MSVHNFALIRIRKVMQNLIEYTEKYDHPVFEEGYMEQDLDKIPDADKSDRKISNDKYINLSADIANVTGTEIPPGTLAKFVIGIPDRKLPGARHFPNPSPKYRDAIVEYAQNDDGLGIELYKEAPSELAERFQEAEHLLRALDSRTSEPPGLLASQLIGSFEGKRITKDKSYTYTICFDSGGHDRLLDVVMYEEESSNLSEFFNVAGMIGQL